MKYKTIIFDLDGTLIDSKINFSAIYQSLRLDPTKSIIEYVNSLSEEDRKSALEIVHHYEEDGSTNSTLMPGVLELLEELFHQNLNLGVFTLNSRAIALKTLKRHQLKIPIVVAREDAKPKPDPEGLVKICDHFSTSADKALYVGDYKYDLIAGKNAKIKTALYTRSTPDFNTTDAYLQFNHFNELSQYLFSPKT
jgi:HAD superfamily hydrolase (TIGR01549 family)